MSTSPIGWVLSFVNSHHDKHKPWINGVRDNLFGWFDAQARHSTRAHMARGFLKSFLLYILPVLLMRRGSWENVRRAFALGVFVAGVRAGDDILTKLKSESFGQSKTNVEEFVTKYTLGVSAFIAALVAINVDGDIQNSVTFVLWTAVRSLRPFAPEVPGGATTLMCLTASQLLSVWVNAPQYHNPVYKKFLDVHGGKTPQQLDALRKLPLDPCSFLHPDLSCPQHFFKFWFNSLPRSFRLYAPVYMISFLLSTSKNIPRTVTGLIRSTFFLSTYCSFAWVSTCIWIFFRNNFLNSLQLPPSPITFPQTFLHTGFSGLAVLFEPHSRRVELAAYCLTYALETVFLFLKSKGVEILSPSVNSLILALSAGILIHHHEHQPKAAVHWLFKLGSGTVRFFP